MAAPAERPAAVKGVSRIALGMWLGFLGMTVFAGTLPATRLAVVGLDPFFITTGRAAVGGLLSACILLLLRRAPPSRGQFRSMVIAVVVMVLGFPTLMAMALQRVPAAHGGVVLGIMPLATAAIASLILGERPSPRFWFFAGLGTLVVMGFALRDSGGHFAIGDVYLMIAALLSAAGYVYSGLLSRSMPGWEVISWILVVALPVTLPAALWLMPADIGAVPAKAWAGFGYVSIFSMFLGFFPWNAGMAMAGVARVSQVQLLQTFVTLGFSALVNGEHIDPVTVVAAVAVVAIVALGGRARVAGPR